MPVLKQILKQLSEGTSVFLRNRSHPLRFRIVFFRQQLGNDFLQASQFRRAKRVLTDTSPPAIVPAGHDQPSVRVGALAQGVDYLQERWSGRHL
jgi:hypothetical protein